MRPIRQVLLVDDEPDIRTVVAACLRTLAGWQVTAVGSGAEALAQTQRKQFDVILLDAMMPDMDGPTALMRLHEQAGESSPPVVFLTAMTKPAEVAHFLSLGAAGVVAKPFDPVTLPQQIRHAVGGE